MFARIIIIAAIFLLIWLAFRYFKSQSGKGAVNRGTLQPKEVEDMKSCAMCGLHMPEDEMLKQHKLYFCSYQHLQQFSDKNIGE